MNRRSFLSAAALPLVAGRPLASAATASSVESANRVVTDRADAPVYERYRLTLSRVLEGSSPTYTEEFLLADVRPTASRRFTEFSGDLSGRYIGALATAARVYGTAFPNLDSLVAKTVALQKPDGFFGAAFHYDKPTDPDLDLLWGNGRLLVGLLEYHRYRPTPSVLAACVRLGDFLLRIAPLMLSKNIRDEFGASHFASSYICWTQQTEGLANLYRVTHDDRYRKLAEDIAGVIERRPGDHVHGYLSSLRGVLDLHQITKDARLLQQCEAAWKDIDESGDLLPTGGVPEGWSPNKHRTEGCAEADWLRFNLALWQATANPQYLSMAERAAFNELAMNQFSTGDFGHRVLTDNGIAGDGAARAWWCCTLHGLRYFPDFQSSAFRADGEALCYDVPIDSDLAKAHVGSAILAATAASSLARDAAVRLTITSASETLASLCVRRPEWAETLNVRINGKPCPSTSEGGYTRMHRKWRTGDVVTVNYAMSLESRPGGRKRVTFSHGPWLLGAPASANATYFNELTAENKLAVAKDPTLAPSPTRPFTVPIAARTFPYAPAEFPNQPCTVTLRAVAEQTAEPPTQWELRFRSGGTA